MLMKSCMTLFINKKKKKSVLHLWDIGAGTLDYSVIMFVDYGKNLKSVLSFVVSVSVHSMSCTNYLLMP